MDVEVQEGRRVTFSSFIRFNYTDTESASNLWLPPITAPSKERLRMANLFCAAAKRIVATASEPDRLAFDYLMAHVRSPGWFCSRDECGW